MENLSITLQVSRVNQGSEMDDLTVEEGETNSLAQKLWMQIKTLVKL